MVNVLCFVLCLWCAGVQISSRRIDVDEADIERIWGNAFHNLPLFPDSIRHRRAATVVVSNNKEHSGTEHSKRKKNETVDGKEADELEKQAEEYARELYKLRGKYPNLIFNSSEQVISFYNEANADTDSRSNKILDSRIYLRPKLHQFDNKDGKKKCDDDSSDIIIEQALKVIKAPKEKNDSSRDFDESSVSSVEQTSSVEQGTMLTPVSKTRSLHINSVPNSVEHDKTTELTQSVTEQFDFSDDVPLEGRSGEGDTNEPSMETPTYKTKSTENLSSSRTTEASGETSEHIEDINPKPTYISIEEEHSFTSEQKTFTPCNCDDIMMQKYKLSKADLECILNNLETIKKTVLNKNNMCDSSGAHHPFLITSNPPSSKDSSLKIPVFVPTANPRFQIVTKIRKHHPRKHVSFQATPSYSFTSGTVLGSIINNPVTAPTVHPQDDLEEEEEEENFRRSEDITNETNDRATTKLPINDLEHTERNVLQKSKKRIHTFYKQDGNDYSLLSDDEYEQLFNDGVQFPVYKLLNGKYVQVPAFINTPLYKLTGDNNYTEVPSSEYDDIIKGNRSKLLYKLVDGKYLTVPEYEVLNEINNFFKHFPTEKSTKPDDDKFQKQPTKLPHKFKSIKKSPFYKLIGDKYVQVPAKHYEDIITGTDKQPLYKLVDGHQYQKIPEHQVLGEIQNVVRGSRRSNDDPDVETTSVHPVKTSYELADDKNTKIPPSKNLKKDDPQIIVEQIKVPQKSIPRKPLYKLDGDSYVEIPDEEYNDILKGGIQYPIYEYSNGHFIPKTIFYKLIGNKFSKVSEKEYDDIVMGTLKDPVYKLVNGQYTLVVPETKIRSDTNVNTVTKWIVERSFVKPGEDLSALTKYQIINGIFVPIPENGVITYPPLYKKINDNYVDVHETEFDNIIRGKFNYPLFVFIQGKYVPVEQISDEQHIVYKYEFLTKPQSVVIPSTSNDSTTYNGWINELSKKNITHDYKYVIKKPTRQRGFIVSSKTKPEPNPQPVRKESVSSTSSNKSPRTVEYYQGELQAFLNTEPRLKETITSLPDKSKFTIEHLIPGISIPPSNFKNEIEYLNFLRGKNEQFRFELLFPGLTNYLYKRYVADPDQKSFSFPEEANNGVYDRLMFLKQVLEEPLIKSVDGKVKLSTSGSGLRRNSPVSSFDSASLMFTNQNDGLPGVNDPLRKNMKRLFATVSHLQERLNSLHDPLQFDLAQMIPGINRPYSTFKNEKEYLDFLQQKNNLYKFEYMLPGLSNILFRHYLANPSQRNFKLSDDLTRMIFEHFMFLKRLVNIEPIKNDNPSLYNISGSRRSVDKEPVIWDSVKDGEIDRKKFLDFLTKYPNIKQQLNALPDFSHFSFEQIIPGLNKSYSSFKDVQEYSGFLQKKDEQYKFELILPGLSEFLIDDYLEHPKKTVFSLSNGFIYDIYETLVLLKEMIKVVSAESVPVKVEAPPSASSSRRFGSLKRNDGKSFIPFHVRRSMGPGQYYSYPLENTKVNPYHPALTSQLKQTCIVTKDGKIYGTNSNGAGLIEIGNVNDCGTFFSPEVTKTLTTHSKKNNQK